MYRKVFSFFLLVFILFPTISSAQTTPKYPSLLWKITGNGLAKPSYLYGTMHVSSKIAFHLGDSFFIALKGADAVALESDPSLWLAEMLHTDEEHELSHEIYQRNNSYNFYKNAFYLPLINNKMISASLARNPELLNGMMYRYSGYGQDFEEETYLDLFIYQSGHRLKKQVIGLEDFAEVDSLLKLAMQKVNDDDDDDEKNKVALKKIRKEGKNASEMLEDAYRRGDLDLLDSVQKLMNGSANYQRYMLEERNKIMARNMDSIMKSKTLFTGIGAAHLAGEQGVIELLRRRGYTLTPVAQHYGKVSKKSKDKIENLSVTRSFATQKSTDGFFEVDIPGTLYEFPEEYFVKEYFYPDLANSAFYSVRRIRTYGPLIHYTAAMMQSKTDSLLFENIPGKLISKKQFKVNGYNAIEILSKLKKGDYQRYVLVFTPIEIVIFRAGGRKDYVKKGEANKFFKSIKINVPNGDWKEYSTYNKDITIKMPSGSFNDETDTRMKRIFSPEKSFQGIEQTTGEYYMLKRASLHDVEYIEEDTFEFNQLEKNFFEKYSFDKIVSQQVGKTEQGFKKYTVHRQFEQNNIFVSWVVNGPFYYLLVALTPDSIKAFKYFNGLQLKSPINYKTFTIEKDTQYYYQVSTNVKVNKQPRYNYYYNGSSSSKKENNDHLEVNKSKHFDYSNTDDEVYMHYRKTHKYDYFENPDSLWVKIKKEENYGNSMHWGEVKFAEKDSVFTWELVLTDTGSTRGIYTKYLVKNRVIYTLKSCIDTLKGPSKFVNEFYGSFWPTDTVIGLSLFVNKADMFFEELWGNDSLAKEQALKSIHKIQFENKHIPHLIKTIQFFSHKDYSTDDKAKLVYKLGKLKGPEILPFFKRYYLAMVDTPLVQVNILQALGKQKSVEAINLFKELIVAETPLLYSNYEMANIFWALNDSLPIAKKTFPMIMEFAQYPEYKSYVYRFVSELLDSGELKTSDLAKYKASIIKETKNDIKRQQASDQKTDRYGYFNSSVNSDLMSLVKLITPYSKEPEVKRIFEKLKKLDNDAIRFALGLHMLKNDLPADDTVWNYLAQKENYRLLVYKELKEISCLNKLSDTLITQEKMAKATIYKNQKVSDKDTIAFLARKETTINGETGFVYFFKRKKNYGNNNWFVDYSGPHPTDTALFNQNPLFTNKGTDLDLYEDIDEQLDKILVSIKNRERRRYADAASGGGYEYYEYGDEEYEVEY